MKNNIRLYHLLIILALFSGACNLPSGTNGTDTASTAAAQTIEALLSATPAIAAISTSTFTPAAVPATLTPIPILTNTPAVPPTSNCNVMQFVTDVTYPDGAIVTPGQNFTKTWRLKNAGTCTWTPSYAVVFSDGNSMNGPSTQALASNVNPGQTIDISVNLTAPAATGDHTGNWKIRDASGVLFGKFYVQIKSQSAVTATNTLPPAVAQVVLNAVASESGTLYEPAAGAPLTILAGDTSANDIARGYMSFDISALSGKTIQNASLAIGSCSTMQDPFTSLGGIWVGEVQYALPLDQSDYNIAGTGITLLNAVPGPIDVKNLVQTRTTEGKARFQIRLHPAGPTDADGQADYISCNSGSVTLTITYQP